MENSKNENSLNELRCRQKELEERQDFLLHQKKQYINEFEDEEFEINFRNKKIDNILSDYPIEDNRLYELLLDSQNAIDNVKKSTLRRVDNFEYNIQKEYNQNCELQREISQKIKKINEEKG